MNKICSPLERSPYQRPVDTPDPSQGVLLAVENDPHQESDGDGLKDPHLEEQWSFHHHQKTPPLQSPELFAP